MKKILLGILVGLISVPMIASASTNASDSEFTWNYDEIATVPGVGVFADTIYLMDDGIPSPTIKDNANLVATYTSDDTLTFAENQTSYLFGGSTDNTKIIVNGNNTINVLMNQKYTLTGSGSLTVQYYTVNEQLKDENSNLLYEVFYDTAYLLDENGENLAVISKEEVASIFDEIKEYNANLVDATYDESKVTLTPLRKWVNHEIDESWVSENITTDKIVTYNADGSVTFKDNNVLETEDVIFESTSNFDSNYKLDVTDILNNVTDELKSNIVADGKVLLALYDISVIDANSEVVPMENGTFTIKIKLTDAMKEYDILTAAYIQDGKVAETFTTTIDDEYVVFNTTHLSEYAIMGSNETTSDVVENPSTGDNIMQYAIVFSLSLIGIGYAMYTLKKEY